MGLRQGAGQGVSGATNTWGHKNMHSQGLQVVAFFQVPISGVFPRVCNYYVHPAECNQCPLHFLQGYP